MPYNAAVFVDDRHVVNLRTAIGCIFWPGLMKNRQWLLAKRPAGPVTPDCFRYNEADHLARPAGSTLRMRIELLLCAPTIRNWMSGNRNSLYPTIEIGDPVMAPAIGWVAESEDETWPVGTRLFGAGAWQDEQWIDPALGYRRISSEISSIDALGIVGINALTGYFGLTHIGQPKPGEVLLVSGAAGSVGSIVAQIGRIKGCRVVALCGGAEKLRWLHNGCQIADVINYKTEDVASALDRLCPNGIDIYFDNVGGTILSHAVARMRRFGRIVLCGQIAEYNTAPACAPPPLDMMRLIYGHVRMEGFLARDYAAHFADAIAEMLQWNKQKLISHREDVRDGFMALPETLATLFGGGNQGTLIVRIADESGTSL